MAIRVHLDRMLASRRMSINELADRVGIKPSNLAVLRDGQALAVKLATLDVLCRELDCQPADLLTFEARGALGEAD